MALYLNKWYRNTVKAHAKKKREEDLDSHFTSYESSEGGREEERDHTNGL